MGTRRQLAWAVAGVATAVGVVSATSLIVVLRDVLHYLCSYIEEGEGAGSWICPDGISYLFPGLSIALLEVALAIVALVLLAGSARSAVLWRLLCALGVAPFILLGVVLWGLGSAGPVEVPPAFFVGVALVAFAAVACAAAAVLAREPVSTILLICAACGSLAAIVVAPSLVSIGALGIGIAGSAALTSAERAAVAAPVDAADTVEG